MHRQLSRLLLPPLTLLQLCLMQQLRQSWVQWARLGPPKQRRPIWSLLSLLCSHCSSPQPHRAPSHRVHHRVPRPSPLPCPTHASSAPTAGQPTAAASACASVRPAGARATALPSARRRTGRSTNLSALRSASDPCSYSCSLLLALHCPSVARGTQDMFPVLHRCSAPSALHTTSGPIMPSSVVTHSSDAAMHSGRGWR